MTDKSLKYDAYDESLFICIGHLNMYALEIISKQKIETIKKNLFNTVEIFQSSGENIIYNIIKKNTKNDKNE